MVIEAERAANQPETVQRYFVLEDDSELSGTDIKNPEQNTDQQTQEPIVTMEFTDDGREAFATRHQADRPARVGDHPAAGLATRDAALQRFAITLDNQIVSLATIDFRENPEGIDGRTGAQINGIGSLQETQDLAESLRIGALPIELKLISQTQVSATLGQQALDQGLLAGGVGLLLTMLFLLIFYRVLGAVAAIALVIYAVFLFALVKLIPITLTLPGIAGLILTLGVAADANIVIFERIKEEARAGQIDPGRHLRRLRQGAAHDHRRQRRHDRRRVHPVHARHGGRQGLRVHAGRRHDHLAVHGRARHLGDPRLDEPHAADPVAVRDRRAGGRRALRLALRLHRALEVLLLHVGLILVVGALAIAGLGINFGIDFESGTRIKTPIEQNASRRRRARRARAARPATTPRSRRSTSPSWARNVFQIATPTLEPEEVARGPRRARRGVRGGPGRLLRPTRSGRPSARRSRARR